MLQYNGEWDLESPDLCAIYSSTIFIEIIPFRKLVKHSN